MWSCTLLRGRGNYGRLLRTLQLAHPTLLPFITHVKWVRFWLNFSHNFWLFYDVLNQHCGVRHTITTEFRKVVIIYEQTYSCEQFPGSSKWLCMYIDKLWQEGLCSILQQMKLCKTDFYYMVWLTTLSGIKICTHTYIYGINIYKYTCISLLHLICQHGIFGLSKTKIYKREKRMCFISFPLHILVCSLK